MGRREAGSEGEGDAQGVNDHGGSVATGAARLSSLTFGLSTRAAPFKREKHERTVSFPFNFHAIDGAPAARSQLHASTRNKIKQDGSHAPLGSTYVNLFGVSYVSFR
jgi:hypothetical protein